MVKLVQEENLQLDVVSEGELYTAINSISSKESITK
jgi:diaminopimelate decarboxylase